MRVGENDRYRFKVCLIGDSSVGKTSLINRFVHNIFDEKYLITIGTNIYRKNLQYPLDDGICGVTMMIWDIMGHKGWKHMLRDAYLYKANGIIAVCDLTRRDTLENLENWVQAAERMAGDTPLTILANKSDLKTSIEFSERDLKRKADVFGAHWHSTSAKTGKNVEHAFNELCGEIISRRRDGARC